MGTPRHDSLGLWLEFVSELVQVYLLGSKDEGVSVLSLVFNMHTQYTYLYVCM